MKINKKLPKEAKIILTVISVLTAWFLLSTAFLTLAVELLPAELPDRIVLKHINGEEKRCQEVVITDPGLIIDISERLDRLAIWRVGAPWVNSRLNPLRRAPGASIYRHMIFEYDEGISVSYKFEYNRIERDGRTYWYLGDPLGAYITLIDTAPNYPEAFE